MRTDTRTDRVRRTLLLLRAAALAAPTPRAARDWLHTPRPELDGMAPGAAAWAGGAVAVEAGSLLALDFGLNMPRPPASGAPGCVDPPPGGYS